MTSAARIRWFVAVLALALLGATVAWWGPGIAGRLGLSSPAPTRPPQPADMPGDVVTEEVARLILPGLDRNPRLAYDPVAIIVNVPGVVATFPWQEHPGGEITFHNDARGFRRLPDAPEAGDGPRILVLGDSHSYGLVDTHETFCHVLEEMLGARSGTEGATVWNASVAGSGPYEYLGSLRKHIGLGPDLVIVVVFTGNDFMNAMPWDEFKTKQRPPVADRAMRQRLADAREHWRAPLAQGFGQALELHSAPLEAERALAAATVPLEEAAALCARHDVPLLVALLPTKVDVDTTDARETTARIFELLQLPEEAYAINAELGARLGRALEGPGVHLVDLAPALEAEPRPLYWRRDHHLAVVGHRVVARTLLPEVEALLAGSP